MSQHPQQSRPRNATHRLREYAGRRGWQIVTSDLEKIEAQRDRENIAFLCCSFLERASDERRYDKMANICGALQRLWAAQFAIDSFEDLAAFDMEGVVLH